MTKAIKDLENKSVGKRKIVIETAAMQNCHIIFIEQSDAYKVKNLLEKFKTEPILTIGSSDNFLKNGGIINLIIEDNKIKFEINNIAAQQREIKISSKLLKLARTVPK